MPTIEKQLELERVMVQRGVSAYEAQLAKAREQGREAELPHARKLMQEFLLPLVQVLDNFCRSTKAAKGGKVRPYLRRCDPYKAMFIALQQLFNSFTYEAQIQGVAGKIGKMIEDEVRFTNFQNLHGDYYSKIKEDFKRKGTRDYRYMHRVLTHKANEKEDGWQDWSQEERVTVGVKLIDIILANTDLVDKVTYYKHGKTYLSLQPTKAASEWIEKHHELAKVLNPDNMPCVIPPDPWTGMYQGGYYTPEMRSRNVLIKTSSKAHKKALLSCDLSKVMEAINHIQNVSWSVNEDVLSVVKEVWTRSIGIGMPPSRPINVPDSPYKGRDTETLSEEENVALTDWKHEAAELYTQEKERVAKSFQVSRIIRMANECASYDRFWFVWYADFRGRLYSATASFSPQGPDLAKGLLCFGERKPLGPRGLYWLKVHTANKFGYDKVSYDDRVAWVDENAEWFARAASSPIDYVDVWGEADKPYQFLAALFELSAYHAHVKGGGSPDSFASRIPIGLDGSCNGLQHFSAMLRDEVGGLATNLVPGDKPADIYRRVAAVATVKVYSDTYVMEMQAEWRAFLDLHSDSSIPRSMAKRPVMTLPYGATRQSCTKYIFSDILTTDRDFFKPQVFKAARSLTPVVWESIGEVVVAAREAMDWLQKSAGIISKRNMPITWMTPDGFLVYQGQYEIETHRIVCELAGRMRLSIGYPSDKIDTGSQRLAISPNFVHSMDSSHLRETVRRMREEGIDWVAPIHDDYGTHACDTEALHRILREAFVSMYTDGNNPLHAYKARQEAFYYKLPALPAEGTLDVSRVLDSKYFFG